MSNEIRGVYVEALALKGVERSGHVIGNVCEAGGVERRRRERPFVHGQILAGGIDRGIVNVPGAYRLTATFVVAEEVAVAAADQQFRGRSPVATERINRERVHSAIVGPEGARIGRSTGIQLAIGAVRAAQLALGP